MHSLKNNRSGADRRENSPVTTSELQDILRKLQAIEAALIEIKAKGAPTHSDAGMDEVLLMKLGQLTLKRHAVLTASIAEVSYKQLAELMNCSETTVKLHLKGAMDTLGIPDRSALLVSHKTMLAAIPESVYLSRFGISKTWWMVRSPSLMAVLTNTKPAANQHTKETV